MKLRFRYKCGLDVCGLDVSVDRDLLLLGRELLWGLETNLPPSSTSRDKDKGRDRFIPAFILRISSKPSLTILSLKDLLLHL